MCILGYLLDDIGDKGKCVLREKCPCESNGKVYKPGEVREGACGSQWYVCAFQLYFMVIKITSRIYPCSKLLNFIQQKSYFLEL